MKSIRFAPAVVLPVLGCGAAEPGGDGQLGTASYDLHATAASGQQYRLAQGASG